MDAVTPETPLLLDVMCGRLATLLRMCGYDAAYALDRGIEDDDRLLDVARAEGRLLITRDVRLAERAERSLLLRETDVDDQLAELSAAGFRLAPDAPTRCSTCNGTLERLPPDAVTPPNAPDPGAQPVWRCRDCGQCFWRGSHWDDVRERLANL